MGIPFTKVALFRVRPVQIKAFARSIWLKMKQKYWQHLEIIKIDLISALRNVTVNVPTAVKRGDNAMLICNYDIENDTLYTVKWYRGRREFYRYTPKENPAWKIFPHASNGINVETSQSNASHVLLRNVPVSLAGRFTCEVSADAPSFHTFFVAGEMDVVELPNQRPIITGIHSRYRLGDIITGNCSSDYSRPAANLTWWINERQAPVYYLRNYEVIKHAQEQMESAVSEINFVITLTHYVKGRLKLKCTASIHDIYEQESEKVIEEDRPRIMASGRSPEMNMYPFDQPTDGDTFNEHELYVPGQAASSLHLNRKLYISSLLISLQFLLYSRLLDYMLLPLLTGFTKMITTTRAIIKTTTTMRSLTTSIERTMLCTMASIIFNKISSSSMDDAANSDSNNISTALNECIENEQQPQNDDAVGGNAHCQIRDSSPETHECQISRNASSFHLR